MNTRMEDGGWRMEKRGDKAAGGERTQTDCGSTLSCNSNGFLPQRNTKNAGIRAYVVFLAIFSMQSVGITQSSEDPDDGSHSLRRNGF
jgi:hypothetical protein